MPNETARLRKVFANPDKRFRFTRHSFKEMADDEIFEADIRHVLAGGYVTWIETKLDELWHVEGKDVDGRSIRVIIAVNEADFVIKIVTAMLL
jgi:hypothetical protein